jgi:amino acid transporter
MAEELKKGVLGFPSLLASAVGLVVASSTLVMLGQGMGIAGYGFVLATAIALVLMIFQSFTFSELALMMPRAGSVSSYTEIAMGHFPAIMSVLSGYVLVQCLAGAGELAIAGIILNKIVFPGVSPTTISIIMLLALTLLNMLGVDIFAAFQVAFTAVMIFTLLVLGFVGLFGHGNPDVHNVSPHVGILNIMSLVSLGIWLVVGSEFSCSLVEEAKNPKKHLPLAMICGLLIIAFCQLFYGMSSMKYVPLDKLAASPTPHVDLAEALMGQAGFYWVALASFCATASTINTVMAAVPRMLYGMAHAGQVPAIFKWLHPRFKTPWMGIIFMAIAPFVLLAGEIATVDSIVTLIVASAFCWIVTYIIAHIDLIILRIRFPDLPRRFRAPFYPVPQILAIAGLIVVLVNIFPDPVLKMRIYKCALLFLLGASFYSFLWCKLKMKKGLFKPVPYKVALEE